MIRFITRLRFLPATIFAAALMLTVKAGNIWDGLDGMVDSAISIAGAEAQQPGTEAPAALPPLPKGAEESVAPDGMTEETAEATGEGMEDGPPPSLSIDDPTLLTQAEIDLLQQLAERRETIEARERELDMRERLMQAAESRIDKKIVELKTLQSTVEELIATYDDQQATKVGSLVKIYENMKPKDAARIFEQLDMDTLLLVAERMKERSLAAIMSDMDPGKARDVTVDLSRRRQLPGTDGQLDG
jgi:flagellar motility protein MotE (MotC chaperone)